MLNLLTRYGSRRSGGGVLPPPEATEEAARGGTTGSSYATWSGQLVSNVRQELYEITNTMFAADTYRMDVQSSDGSVTLATVTGVVAPGGSTRVSFALGSSITLEASTTYRILFTPTAARRVDYGSFAVRTGTKWSMPSIAFGASTFAGHLPLGVISGSY